MAAANLGIYLTLQAEGCSLELWNTHKGFLKQDFRRIVQEVKAQRRAEQEIIETLWCCKRTGHC